MPILYEIWRQDDNGNRFLVDTCPDGPSAERRIIELTRCIHKQMYWIEQRTVDDCARRSLRD